MTNKSIITKIIKMRSEVVVKKNGYNKHKNYYYYLPEDIMSATTEVCQNNKVYDKFSMPYCPEKQKYVCTLELTDMDTGEKEVFIYDSLVSEPHGADGAQQSGGTLTYGKRYSYMNAFNISENTDDPDHDNATEKTKKGSAPSPKPNLQKSNTQPTPKQQSKSSAGKGDGVTSAQLKLLKGKQGDGAIQQELDLTSLTKRQASDLIDFVLNKLSDGQVATVVEGKSALADNTATNTPDQTSDIHEDDLPF